MDRVHLFLSDHGYTEPSEIPDHMGQKFNKRNLGSFGEWHTVQYINFKREKAVAMLFDNVAPVVYPDNTWFFKDTNKTSLRCLLWFMSVLRKHVENLLIVMKTHGLNIVYFDDTLPSTQSVILEKWPKGDSGTDQKKLDILTLSWKLLLSLMLELDKNSTLTEMGIK